MNIRKKYLWYPFIILALVLPACNSNTSNQSGNLNDSVVTQNEKSDVNADRYLYPVFKAAEKHSNILYAEKPDFKGNKQKLLLDLYEPENDKANSRAVVLLAHGGSYFTGSKEDMGKFAEDLAKKGYVVISANYRLRENPVVEWSGAVMDATDDMGSVYDWILKHGAAYRLDTKHIAIGGESAGGELTLSFMNAGNRIWKNRDKSDFFAIINLYGPMSPANTIDPKSPPVLFIHGTEDRTAPYSDTLNMVKLHRDKGVYTELFTMEGEGHGTDKYWPDVLFEMTQFLHKMLLNLQSPALSIKDTPVTTSFRGEHFLVTLDQDSQEKGIVRAVLPKGWQANVKNKSGNERQYEITVPAEASRDYYPVQFDLVGEKGKVKLTTDLYVNLKNPLGITIKPALSKADPQKIVNAVTVSNLSNTTYNGTILLKTANASGQRLTLEALRPGVSTVLETELLEGEIESEVELMNGVHFTVASKVDIHKYEAENAEMSNAQLGTYPADSGGFHIGHIDALDSSVEFKQVIVPDAGIYSLEILYSNGWGETAGQLLTVNQDEGTAVQYPPTSNWGDIGSKKVKVKLKKGINSIKLNYSGEKSTDIDAIIISNGK